MRTMRPCRGKSCKNSRFFEYISLFNLLILRFARLPAEAGEGGNRGIVFRQNKKARSVSREGLFFTAFASLLTQQERREKVEKKIPQNPERSITCSHALYS